MSLFKKIAFSMLMITTIGATELAIAKEMPLPATERQQSAKPVMVIRFNAPGVRYKQQLANVVSQAQGINPNVRFDVQSLIPAEDDMGKAEDLARYNSQKVEEALTQSGVERARIKLIVSPDNTIHMNEVRIFAY